MFGRVPLLAGKEHAEGVAGGIEHDTHAARIPIRRLPRSLTATQLDDGSDRRFEIVYLNVQVHHHLLLVTGARRWVWVVDPLLWGTTGPDGGPVVGRPSELDLEAVVRRANDRPPPLRTLISDPPAEKRRVRIAPSPGRCGQCR
jgi:hypothetical protein